MNQKQRILNRDAPVWASSNGQCYKGVQPKGTLVRIDASSLSPKERKKIRPLPPVWYMPRFLTTRGTV